MDFTNHIRSSNRKLKDSNRQFKDGYKENIPKSKKHLAFIWVFVNTYFDSIEKVAGYEYSTISLLAPILFEEILYIYIYIIIASIEHLREEEKK